MVYVEIGAKYLKWTNIVSNFDSKILYVRPDVRNLFSSLRDVVSSDTTACTISGPPGVGKSFATFVFMCSLLDSYTITWVSVSRGNPKFLQFNKGRKNSGILYDPKELTTLLEKPELEGRMHVAILDGYRDSYEPCVLYGDACITWLQCNPTQHRFVPISSMGGFKIGWDLKLVLNWENLDASSWAKEDYFKAIENPKFFGQVKKMLDAQLGMEADSLRSAPTTEELISSKIYYAGGSSRFMFDVPTKVVKDNIDRDILKCSDLSKYIFGDMPLYSSDTVHSLISSYEYGVAVPVSDHAAVRMAEKLGPDLVLKFSTSLRKNLGERLNPSLDGILYEM
jgi:hypothetical protein